MPLEQNNLLIIKTKQLLLRYRYPPETVMIDLIKKIDANVSLLGAGRKMLTTAKDHFRNHLYYFNSTCQKYATTWISEYNKLL
jgi:hypothetical protein